MMQSTTIATLLILLANLIQGSSFVTLDVGRKKSCGRNDSSPTTTLFGTIRFVGTARAFLDIPSIITIDEDKGDKSLSTFLASSASDSALLGKDRQLMNGNQSSADSGALWECKQASVQWFGMSLIPIFINRIEKNPSRSNVIISIIDARTEVEQAGRLGIGNTLASTMERSEFEGSNAVSWVKNESASDDNVNDNAISYALEGNLDLTLTINLPRFLPLPPGFNKIGSKIVARTCRERLRQNLGEISDAYSDWVMLP